MFGTRQWFFLFNFCDVANLLVATINREKNCQINLAINQMWKYTSYQSFYISATLLDPVPDIWGLLFLFWISESDKKIRAIFHKIYPLYVLKSYFSSWEKCKFTNFCDVAVVAIIQIRLWKKYEMAFFSHPYIVLATCLRFF